MTVSQYVDLRRLKTNWFCILNRKIQKSILVRPNQDNESLGMDLYPLWYIHLETESYDSHLLKVSYWYYQSYLKRQVVTPILIEFYY